MATPKSWTLGDGLTVTAKHHASIETLWNTKWRFPCKIGAYPFHDGKYEDFELVFESLIKESMLHGTCESYVLTVRKSNVNDAYTYSYTDAFFPVCNTLLKRATTATSEGHHAKASALYLRVAALYRISRFPIMTSPIKWKAYEAQKAAYMMATAAWVDPIQESFIPHVHANGADKLDIPVYVRLPSTASPSRPAPTILLITGLDGYRPDNTQRTYEFLRRGWGCVIAEIPGTADCPADPKDATSPDRLWSSIFVWMRKQGVFDMRKISVWGLSTGAYYAVRIAHTHRDQIVGSVAHGAGVHHFFSQEWLEHADKHEYPFTFTPALAQKFGYDNVEDFKSCSQKKFSLVESGIVNRPSSRLFLVNGTHDGLMPVEDSLLMMEYGSPKESRLFPKLLHMGYPTSNTVIYPWLESVMRRCC